jgi:multiple sugar transport system substrate-binding protein
MNEIEFSVISYDPGIEGLDALLAGFEAQHRVQVRSQTLSWPTAWADVVKFAIYGHGPAVSEVGSTWVATLAAMNALRPFTQAEVSQLGGASAFLPALWQVGTLGDDSQVWAVPWLADTRVIYYRRDRLASAGVDERTAFQTHAHLEETLQRLRAGGIAVPWAVPTRTTLNTLHYVASWVWGAGGDFVDRAGRKVLFDQENALTGIRAYFNLHRFLPSQRPALDDSQAEELFLDGHAAVTLGGPWFEFDPTLASQVGIALPPGVPHVSGSHLVIWRSVTPRQQSPAYDLVRYLTARNTQRTSSQHVRLMPARVEVLGDAPFVDTPTYQVMSQGLRTGRAFPSFRLWGMIEERLTAAFGSIWQRVLADPNADLDAVIRAELKPLAQRLNVVLESAT